jgi:hypothetical protein
VSDEEAAYLDWTSALAEELPDGRCRVLVPFRAEWQCLEAPIYQEVMLWVDA